MIRIMILWKNIMKVLKFCQAPKGTKCDEKSVWYFIMQYTSVKFNILRNPPKEDTLHENWRNVKIFPM